MTTPTYTERKVMKKYLFILIIGLLVAACSDDESPFAQDKREVLELTIRIPEMEKEAIVSRSSIIPDVDRLQVAFCSAAGSVISVKDVTLDLSAVENSKGLYKLKLEVPDGTVSVSLVANLPESMDPKKDDKLNSIQFTSLDGLVESIPMYGSALLTDLTKEIEPRVELVRILSRTDVRYEKQAAPTHNDTFDGFTIIGVKGFYFASKGLLVGNEENIEGDRDGLSLAYAKSGFYSFETIGMDADGNYPRLILKARIGENEYYYPMEYITVGDNGTEKRLDVERNHHYTFTITQVNALGYATEEEALKAPAENRLTIELKDDHEEIFNMISCKDYELGVCENDTVSYETQTSVLKVVVSTMPDGRQYVPEFSYPEKRWVKSHSVKSETSVAASSFHAAGVMYEVEFTLEQNDHSQDTREEEITVKAGDLERKVKIVQIGRDFLRDRQRVVKIEGLKPERIPYFDFIDNELKGEEPEMNGGRVRNAGLHFSTTQNAYTYYIPFLQGDVLTSGGSDAKFSIAQDGNFWVVKLRDDAPVEETWISSFTIRNEANVDIKFDVYRTGIFHDLPANSYTIKGETGWRYYEQVKTTTGVVMLDRNLGADCCQFYTPNVSDLQHFQNAPGEYYLIAEDKKDGTVFDTYCPEGFIVPDHATLSGLGLTVTTTTLPSGQMYYCYRIPVTGAKLENGAVESYDTYVPVSGYYEGDTQKNLAHACLWSLSPLSGNQGFDTTSPEYGYWYIYLDINAGKMVQSNMRIVNGSAGNSTGLGYKYMPVRCVINKGYAPGAMRKIYYTDSKSWGKVRAYYWGGSTTIKWPGIDMTNVSGNRYSVEIPKDATNIIFNNGKYDGIADTDWNNKTHDIDLTDSSEYVYR